jgi:hypothetical protein
MEPHTQYINVFMHSSATRPYPKPGELIRRPLYFCKIYFNIIL